MFKFGFWSFDIRFQIALNRRRLFGVEIGALLSHNELTTVVRYETRLK